MPELKTNREVLLVEKRHKILIVAVIFVIAATIAGYNIEKRENTKFTVETVSDEEAAEYDSGGDVLINGRININTADAELLEKLDGVGRVTAQRIIDYRTENGIFENIEDIMKVEGIGMGRFEKLKDKICCGGNDAEMEKSQ